MTEDKEALNKIIASLLRSAPGDCSFTGNQEIVLENAARAINDIAKRAEDAECKLADILHFVKNEVGAGPAEIEQEHQRSEEWSQGYNYELHEDPNVIQQREQAAKELNELKDRCAKAENEVTLRRAMLAACQRELDIRDEAARIRRLVMDDDEGGLRSLVVELEQARGSMVQREQTTEKKSG